MIAKVLAGILIIKKRTESTAGVISLVANAGLGRALNLFDPQQVHDAIFVILNHIGGPKTLEFPSLLYLEPTATGKRQLAQKAADKSKP